MSRLELIEEHRHLIFFNYFHMRSDYVEYTTKKPVLFGIIKNFTYRKANCLSDLLPSNNFIFSGM